MPEAAEVETIRRQLDPLVAGRGVVRVDVLGPRVARRCSQGALRALDGARLLRAERVGKFLLVRVEDGSALVVHLGMSGRLRVVRGRSEEAHVTLRVVLSDGAVVEMVDPRTFGEAFVVPPYRGARPEALGYLGVDVLAPVDEVVERSGSRVRHSARWVKRLLLDQRVVAGLGNMYADEACFRARIDPRVEGRALSECRWREVVAAAHGVVEDALAAGGTTFPDRSYRNLEGEGRFFDRLTVYQRHGEPCVACGTAIARVPFDGRYTHFCPSCQRGA